MNKKPLFSIIVPTFNRANKISRSIQSVLDQTYPDFELIIVDDGSTDNTQEVINKFHDNRIRYFLKINEERGAARNYGINNAKGQYITFLDSDDLIYPNHFEEAYSFIKKEQPEVFHQQYEIRDGAKKKSSSIKTSIKTALIKGNPLSCMGVFIKREIAIVNLFIQDRRISGSEDYELWLRYASKYNFLYNPICTSSLIIHDDRSVFKMGRDKLIERKLLMVDYAFKDEDVKLEYTSYRDKILAYSFSYIALHLALLKNNNILAFKYLFKAIMKNPLLIFEKRFYAVIKRLIV